MSECDNCNKYDYQTHSCPIFCDVIRNTLDDVRADEHNNTIEEFVKFIDKHTHENGTEICLDDDITILAEEFLKGEQK